MSSYISPAPQGDPKATGAYAIAIAETAGGTNNDGHATDSDGNVVVDRAWGNLPLQPNDVRRATATNFGGVRGSDVVTLTSNGTMRGIPGEGADYGWSATTQVASTNLAYTNITIELNNGITFAVKPDNHEIAQSEYSAYPSYAEGSAVYIITQASGNGSVQTYTAPNNFLAAGDVVNITGTGLDGTSLTVASANRYTFTVSGSGTGSYINITGRVRYANELTATDGAYINGTAFVKVPSVLGLTTALGQDALTDASLVVTTAAAATNAAGSITDIDRAAGSTTVELTGTGFTAAYPVGTKITVASTGTVDGTWTVTGNTSTNKIRFTSNASTVLTSGTGSIIGVPGTIKTQSIAANANSIAAGAAVTITPWAAAS